MKNLTFIRHAETYPTQDFESDRDRILTPFGLHQIENIAKQLIEKKFLPDYLLCSPAKRAIQTAQLLCEKLKINPRLLKISPKLYSGDTKIILQAFFLLNLAQRAFIIGHNPTLSYLAHKLCLTTKSIILPPAGVISINFDIEKWNELLTRQGTLLFFIEPEHE
jgi:phosphohistidine phosphatase